MDYIEQLNYGPVKILKGIHKGRIGYYDDREGDKAIIYFADMSFSNGYVMINGEHVTNSITTADLFDRKQEIYSDFHKSNSDSLKIEFLSEMLLINSAIYEKYINARFKPLNKEGKKIFISHSSIDKSFANSLYTDLKDAGHNPWLDEWNIGIGQSIPKEISLALDSCDYMILILSKNTVKSDWVEKEWESTYWSEVMSNQIKILPVLIENCEIPTLLKTKKYADFRLDYKKGFLKLLETIK